MSDIKLTESEYRIVLEKAPIMVWRSGVDTMCNYFNETWLLFTGNSMEQELGIGWLKGVHPDDIERCKEIYTSNFEQRKIFEMEYRLRRHDNEYRWVFDRGAPFTNHSGDFSGYIGSCIDVTRRIEVEEQLKRHQEEELARVEQLLPVCAWCGKIRNDEGYWQAVSDYLREQRLGAASHGICEGCASRLN